MRGSGLAVLVKVGAFAVMIGLGFYMLFPLLVTVLVGPRVVAGLQQEVHFWGAITTIIVVIQVFKATNTALDLSLISAEQTTNPFLLITALFGVVNLGALIVGGAVVLLYGQDTKVGLMYRGAAAFVFCAITFGGMEYLPKLVCHAWEARLREKHLHAEMDRKVRPERGANPEDADVPDAQPPRSRRGRVV